MEAICQFQKLYPRLIFTLVNMKQMEFLVEDLNEREIENIMLEFLKHLHQEQISVSSAASVKFWELYREHPLRKHYSMFVHSKAAISEVWLKHLTKVE